MDIQFNSLEIFKMAMDIEKQGRDFYQRCVEANSEAKIKEIFSKLRDDEEDHYELFKDMLDEFEKEDKSLSQNYLYNEEVSGYLHSLVDSKVFPETQEATDKLANDIEEAINIGIKAEKNSLLLYLELVHVEEDKQTIEALEKLILEEKKHLTQLKDLKSQLLD